MSKVKERLEIVNRKARHDYAFEKMMVAGITLVGSEVKSIRAYRVSFVDSYCMFHENELYIKNLNISDWNYAAEKHATNGDRKLLMKRRELDKLQKELINGMTLVPYKIFENERGILKLEIALAKGKKSYDKKDTLKERDIKRETDKELKLR